MRQYYIIIIYINKSGARLAQRARNLMPRKRGPGLCEMCFSPPAAFPWPACTWFPIMQTGITASHASEGGTPVDVLQEFVCLSSATPSGKAFDDERLSVASGDGGP